MYIRAKCWSHGLLTTCCVAMEQKWVARGREWTQFSKLHVLQKYLKDNKLDSLHLRREYARIFVLGHYLFFEACSFPQATLLENCSHLRTDINDRKQISKHILHQMEVIICLANDIFTCKSCHKLLQSAENASNFHRK